MPVSAVKKLGPERFSGPMSSGLIEARLTERRASSP